MRHQLKLFRSKAMKGQLETAPQYVSHLRRVQTEIWPLISDIVQSFEWRGANVVIEAPLSKTAIVDVTHGTLLSGTLREILFWNVARGSADFNAWMALWYAMAPFGSTTEMWSALADCLEYGKHRI